MFRLLFLVLLLIPTFSFAQPVDSIGQRQRAVENGLLPEVVLEGEPVPTFSLRERMEHRGVPGVSIAVINNGHVEWTAGYGVRETGRSDSVTASTLFQAASISKPVAALGALRLVDQNRLRLDQDVNQYLKSWTVPKNKYTSEHPVTLRLLLSHGAGLTVGGFPGYRRSDPIPSAVDVLEGRGNTAPVRVDTIPGRDYRYSGGGSTVVQVLIEDIAGASFGTVLAQQVLDPLGMYRSTFAQPLPNRLHEEAATAHRPGDTPIDEKWHVYPELAAAGLWSTPLDLARFALGIRDAYLGKEGALLDQPLAEEMLTQQNETYGLGPGVAASGDSLWFAHSGGNAGFKSHFLLYPETGDGLAMMTNADGGRALNFEIIRAVSRVYDWPLHKPEVRSAVTLPLDTLDSYTGRYRTEGETERNVRVLRKQKQLHLAWPAAPEKQRQRLVPTSTTEFVLSETGGLATFKLDEQPVVLEIDGQRAERVE